MDVKMAIKIGTSYDEALLSDFLKFQMYSKCHRITKEWHH